MTAMECLSCKYFVNNSSIKSWRTTLQDGKCGSLLEQCFNVISQQSSLCEPSRLRNLPVTVLDDLKFYLGPDKLHSLSSLFEQTGIDTSLAWKRLLHRRYGSRVLALCDEHVAPRVQKSVFQVSMETRDPHQVFLAKHCQQILQCILENGMRVSSEGYSGVCKQCNTNITSYLTNVTSLVLSWKQIVSILTADFPMIIPFRSSLCNLVDLELHNITFKDKDTVTKCLRKLIKGNTLKSLAFVHTTRRNVNDSILNILEIVYSSDECSGKYMTDKSINKKFEESKPETKETLDLFDEALNFNGNQSYWVNDIDELVNIRDKIKAWSVCQVDCRDGCQSMGGLESLNFPLGDDDGTKQRADTARRMYNLFSRLETVKRLDLRNIGVYDCTDVFLMLGCHRLTHLRLNFTHEENRRATTLLLAVLFEYFRFSHSSNVAPLEYLGLCDILSSKWFPSQSLAHYDFDISAVKKLDLLSCEFHATSTHNLLHFLFHNKALTYLNLTDVQFTEPSVNTELPPFLRIVNAIASVSCLETLIVKNIDGGPGYIMIDDDRQEEAVVTLLTDRPHLKHLVLECCRLRKSFVSSCSFISAVTQHKGLEHLSLSHNHLDLAAVKLLHAICDTRRSHSLKGLCLESCSIPGKSLLEAASQISGVLQGQLFLRYLNLNQNCVTLRQLRAIQSLFGRCVKLLDIKGCTDHDVAAVKLLHAICDARRSHSLKGLRLESCSIPGESLLEAAGQISGVLQGELFLRYLNLNKNSVTLRQLGAIQGLFDRCVELVDIQELVDIKGCTNYGKSRLAHLRNFYEEEISLVLEIL